MWQHYRDKTAINNAGDNVDFHADVNNRAWFKFKRKILGKIDNDRTKDLKIMVRLKYL